MTNSANTTNTTTAINTIAQDEQFEQYLESLESWTRPAFDGTLATSYAEAERIRDSYRRWILQKLDEVEKARQELMARDDVTDEEIDTFAMLNDTSFLESELERLMSADDVTTSSGAPGYRFVRVEEARSKAHATIIREALEALEDETAFIVGNDTFEKALNDWAANVEDVKQDEPDVNAYPVIAVKTKASLSHTLPARVDLGELEYGISEDLPRWYDQGWTVPRKDADGRPNPERVNTCTEFADECINTLSSDDLQFYLETAQALCWTEEQLFEVDESGDLTKASKQASQLIKSTTERFFEKGDHDTEILWQECTWTFDDKDRAQAFVNKVRGHRKGKVIATRIVGEGETKTFEADVVWPLQQTPNGFKVVTLKADGNWGSWDNYGHRRMRAFARDRYVDELLERVMVARTANDLNAIRREAGRASRDNQVLTFDKKGRRFAHTHDSARVVKTNKGWQQVGRKVGLGLNFERYAMVMNAVADRAEELDIKGFDRRYNVDQFEKTVRPEKDGDMLDAGCAVGEFVALEMPDDLDLHESVWQQLEGTWKPSDACRARLDAAGPTGFVWRSWKELLADTDAGFNMTSCGSLGSACAA